MITSLEQIYTPDAPNLIEKGFSQGIKTSNLIFVAGQMGFLPDTGEMISLTDVEAQTFQVMTNIGAILRAENLSFGNIAKTTIFMTDITNYDKINKVYKSFFTDFYPARSTIQVAALADTRALVEIEVIAAL